MWLVLPLLASTTLSFEHLATAAADSPRPPECRQRATASWYEPRQRQLRQYCWALAAGYAELSSHADRALKHAERARAQRPQSPAALLLRARALLRTGHAAEALQAFEAADLKHASAGARLDYARALLAARRWRDARDAYVAALALRGILGDDAREQVVLEAASALVLAADPLDLQWCESVLWPAYRERTSVSGRASVTLLLSFVLALRGQERQARELAASVNEAAPDLPVPPHAAALAPLLAAWELEQSDPAEARSEWQGIAGRADGAPWQRWARERLKQLGGESQ